MKRISIILLLTFLLPLFAFQVNALDLDEDISSLEKIVEFYYKIRDVRDKYIPDPYEKEETRPSNKPSKYVTKIKEAIVESTLKLVVEKMLKTDSFFIKSPIIKKIYYVVLGIVGAMATLLFTFIGLCSIVGRRVEIEDVIMKIVFSGMILVATLFSVEYAINLSNAITRKIISGTIGLDFVQEWIESSPDTILFLIFIVIVAIFSVRLLIFYYIRFFEIISIYLFSPVAVFFWLGGKEGVLKTCLKELLVLIFTPCVHAIQLAILVGVSMSPITYFSNVNDQVLLTIAALITMLKTPIWLHGLVHQSGDPYQMVSRAFDFMTFKRERMLMKKF